MAIPRLCNVNPGYIDHGLCRPCCCCWISLGVPSILSLSKRSKASRRSSSPGSPAAWPEKPCDARLGLCCTYTVYKTISCMILYDICYICICKRCTHIYIIQYNRYYIYICVFRNHMLMIFLEIAIYLAELYEPENS